MATDERENEAKWVLNHVAQSYLRGEIDAVPYAAYLYLRGRSVRRKILQKKPDRNF